MSQPDNPDNLPVVRDQSSPVYTPTDVGDREAVPHAHALDYHPTTVQVTTNLGGTDRIMYDDENGDARIECDANAFVDDITDWA
jgi:hypothetical protein